MVGRVSDLDSLAASFLLFHCFIHSFLILPRRSRSGALDRCDVVCGVCELVLRVGRVGVEAVFLRYWVNGERRYFVMIHKASVIG